MLKAVRQYTRLACCRQFQKSIDESVKPTIEWAINHLGLAHEFIVDKYRIRCPRTKSEFFFAGLERNIESVRGWHDLTDVWVEEANLLREEAALVLLPTIMRGEHQTEFWVTFNPKYRSDWVYRRFISNPEPGDITIFVTWAENPWHTDQSETLRRRDRKLNPMMYSHVWEGMPDDGDGDKKVLSYAILRDCVDAYKAGLHERAIVEQVESGLDIADGGGDQNCHVIRRGPIITSVDAWYAERPGWLTPTARRAHNQAIDAGVRRLSYDAGGVGAPIRESFSRLFEGGRRKALRSQPGNVRWSRKG